MEEKTKKYIYWAVGIIVVILVIWGISALIKNNNAKRAVQNGDVTDMTGMQTYSGSITRTLQGDHTLNYEFVIPEAATATVSMNNALVTVTNDKSAYASIYFSYEGSRKYSAVDYINKVIKPRVPKAMIASSTEDSNWTVAASTGSEWHVVTTTDGQWLVVIESPKALHDEVEKTIESFKTQ